jgi:hypothetical protein
LPGISDCYRPSHARSTGPLSPVSEGILFLHSI